jgi:hypothetical protein
VRVFDHLLDEGVEKIERTQEGDAVRRLGLDGLEAVRTRSLDSAEIVRGVGPEQADGVGLVAQCDGVRHQVGTGLFAIVLCRRRHAAVSSSQPPERAEAPARGEERPASGEPAPTADYSTAHTVHRAAENDLVDPGCRAFAADVIGVVRRPHMAVYTVDLGTVRAQAECDTCGWLSSPVDPATAHQWAASHRRRCASGGRPVVQHSHERRGSEQGKARTNTD